MRNFQICFAILLIIAASSFKILTTAPDVTGLGLSIEGQTAQSTCQLAPIVHREIIDLAVELAVADYRDGTLKARMALDSRV